MVTFVTGVGVRSAKWGRGAGAFLLGLERRCRLGLSNVKRAYRRGELPGPEAIDLLTLWATCPREFLNERELELVAWARRMLPYYLLKPTLAKCRPTAAELNGKESVTCQSPS